MFASKGKLLVKAYLGYDVYVLFPLSAAIRAVSQMKVLRCTPMKKMRSLLYCTHTPPRRRRCTQETAPNPLPYRW